MSALTTELKRGLDAPICLTWELTYACNLACVHCLSSSGRRDPRELTTDEAKALVDELRRMQVFYVNIGGGEPTIRRDFFEIVDYCVSGGVGVKFSTNGAFIDAAAAQRLAATDYLDVQISLDGIDAATNDALRGDGSYAIARRAMDHLADAGVEHVHPRQRAGPAVDDRAREPRRIAVRRHVDHRHRGVERQQARVVRDQQRRAGLGHVGVAVARHAEPALVERVEDGKGAADDVRREAEAIVGTLALDQMGERRQHAPHVLAEEAVETLRLGQLDLAERRQHRGAARTLSGA